MRYHEFGEFTYEWLQLYVQAEEHLINVPVANKLDYVAANEHTEELHDTCCVEGMIGDVLGFEYQIWVSEHDGGLEGLVDHGWCYILPYYCQRHVTE